VTCVLQAAVDRPTTAKRGGVDGVEDLDDQLVSDDARPRRSPGRKGCCRWRRGRCSPSSWAARSRG